MKQTIRHILFSFALAAVSMAAQAEDCLILHLTDGNKIMFRLAERPKITFEGGLVCIKTDRLRIENVSKYTIADVSPAGIDAPKDGAGGAVDVRGNTAYVQTKDGNAQVKCHAADGKELPVGMKRLPGGVVAVDLSAAPRGVVIITVGDESIKIQRP